MHRPPPHNPLQALLPRAPDSCTPCPVAVCPTCSSGETCVATFDSVCGQCQTYKCAKNPTNSNHSGKSVSGGAVAGAVVGSLVLLAVAVVLFIWHRRRVRAARSADAPAGPKEQPASAADVLNRPDPNEKAQQEVQQQQQQQAAQVENTIRMFDSSHTDINLDPEAQLQVARGQLQPPSRGNFDNPFSDAQSIQTTSTGSQSTNVIPIALVPRTGGNQAANSVSTRSTSPSRPARSPDLDLNLAHLNVSKDSMPANYASSNHSGASGALRNSYLSTATGATDFLNEAPIIVTPTHRQVLGVAKPEVVHAPGSAPTSTPTTPMSGDGLKVQLASRPSIRSPLATTSFGPSDVVKEEGGDEGRGNPFGDEHSPIPAVPAVPSWATDKNDRPVSMQTMATNVGTIIADIGSATRVQLGFVGQSAASSPMHSPASAPRLLQRMASGRLVTPRSGPNSGPQEQGTLQEQQERALAHAQEKAREQGLELHRRISGSSVVSSASTRADSILESFPFVPPSPISSLPTRSPSTRSPLSREARSPTAEPDSPTRRAALVPTPPSPSPLDPPDRRILGMSTGSQLSTASSGLGAFDFQVEPMPAPAPPPPTAFRGLPPQRASLDTLALTQDLSSYPLGFEQRRPAPGEP